MQKEKMTYETAASELENIFEKMSSEEITLDESLKLYAKAAELIVFCNKALEKAQIKLDEINAKLENCIVEEG